MIPVRALEASRRSADFQRSTGLDDRGLEADWPRLLYRRLKAAGLVEVGMEDKLIAALKPRGWLVIEDFGSEQLSLSTLQLGQEFPMDRSIRCLLGVAGLALLVAGTAAVAQDVMRVRGTIERVPEPT